MAKLRTFDGYGTNTHKLRNGRTVVGMPTMGVAMVGQVWASAHPCYIQFAPQIELKQFFL